MGAVSLLEDIVDRETDNGLALSQGEITFGLPRYQWSPWPISSPGRLKLPLRRKLRNRVYVTCPSCHARINAHNLNRHFRRTRHNEYVAPIAWRAVVPV